MINVVYVNMCLFCSHVWIFTFNDPYCPGYPHSPTFLGFSFWLLAVYTLSLLTACKWLKTVWLKTGVGGRPGNRKLEWEDDQKTRLGWVPVSRPLHLFNTSNKIACWWSWKQGYIYQQVHILGGRGKTCCSTAWIKPANWLQSQSSAQSVQLMRYWPDVALWLFMLYSFNKIQIVFINMT